MAGSAKFDFRITQLYPGSGAHELDTCANLDCSSFGAPLTTASERRADWATKRFGLSSAALDVVEKHGPGACRLAGADKQHRHVSRVLDYENDGRVRQRGVISVWLRMHHVRRLWVCWAV